MTQERDNTYLKGNKFAARQGPNRTSFKKGMRPWNKGKKGIHLSPSSEFKKNGISINHLPVGSLRKRKDKNGRVRRWIKIGEPRQWKLYAVYLWEYLFGCIPDDELVHHRNDNCLDDRPENLELMTRAEHIAAHREKLVAAKVTHLKVQFKLYPEITSRRRLRGYKFASDIGRKIRTFRSRLALEQETSMSQVEARQGQKALWE